MNRTVKIWLTFFLLGFGTLGLGQNPDIKRTWHWYFGSGAGLDFSTGSAIPDTTSNIYTIEACFAMSDTCGDLLFYGDNDTIWNKNHQMMQNGEIIPLVNNGNPTQAVAVPQPGNDSIYYVFYARDEELTNNLYYAIIDMNRNAGLGEVISKDMVLITSASSEKAAAVHNCNGLDIWIAADQITNDSLYAFLLTASGLNTVPVVSSVSSWSFDNGGGYLKFSPNGQMAAAAMLTSSPSNWDNSIIELYQFDNCTGVFSNPIAIPFACPYGLSFSPDNSKLYAGTYTECYSAPLTPVDTGYLFQYDVSTYNLSAILASETIIASGQGKSYDNFQIGPFGEIYVADTDTGDWYLNFDSLGVIHNPNLSGLGCNYSQEEIYLEGSYSWIGFPSFVESYFNNLNYYDCYTSIDEVMPSNLSTIQLLGNQAKDYLTLQNKAAEQVQFKIYNLSGKFIFSGILPGSSTTNFDVQPLSPGMYIVNTQTNNLFSNLKFIKL